MVLPYSHRISRVRWYSFVRQVQPFVYAAFTLSDALFQKASTKSSLVVCTVGLLPVRSPLLRESRLLSFPPATEMFQFTGSPLLPLWIGGRMTGSSPAGFLHSETCGSTLFAAHRSYRLLASFFGTMCQGIRLVLFSV